MIAFENKLYGKPKTPEIAFKYLTELAGKKHTVYTGVVIKNGDKISRFHESTDVTFGNVTHAQILAYVDTGEPL